MPMPKVHSHYDNLKVERNASPETIRAAYRALTHTHHPDRNPGNADAERVMAVINVAYDTLSDPLRRQEHDRWIAQAEAPPERSARGRPTLHSPAARHRDVHPGAGADATARLRARRTRFDRRVRRVAAHLRRFGAVYGIAGAAALYLAITTAPAPLTRGLTAATATEAAAVAHKGSYSRSSTAPNGQGWPTRSGYVDGYGRLNDGGLSEITVDNSQNDTDMFAKLVSLDGPTAFPVRTFFVAARSRFTLAGLIIGTYDLRYRNLASGALSRSPAFILEEVPTDHGVQRSAMTLALYKTGGNMQAYALSDADF